MREWKGEINKERKSERKRWRLERTGWGKGKEESKRGKENGEGNGEGYKEK